MTQSIFSSTAIKVFSKSISLDLIQVQPMDGVSDYIKNEINQINRDKKIDYIINGEDYKEMSIKDHPDYKPVNNSSLFYLDHKYIDSSIIGTNSNLQSDE